MSRYPALEQFLGGYLHQDWMHDYADVWAAVDDFARSEPDHAPALVLEIGALLASDIAEMQLRSLVVDELDGQYLVDRDGWTYRAWLGAVAERVQKVLDEQAGR